MTTIALRKKLADYLKVDDEIEKTQIEYTAALKNELNKRLNAFKNGGRMVTAGNAKKQVDKILQ